MTLVWLLGLATLVGAYVVNVVLDNVLVTTTLQPAVAFDADAFRGDLAVSVDLERFVGSCDASSAISAPFTSPAGAIAATSDAPGHCRLEWTCADCVLTEPAGALVLQVRSDTQDVYAAGPMRWRVHSSAFADYDADDAMTLAGAFDPPPGHVHRGTPLGALSLAVFRGLRADTAGNTTGLLLSRSGAVPGRVVNASAFAGADDAVGVTVSVSASELLLRIDVQPAAAPIEVAANLLSLATGSLAGARLALSLVQRVVDRRGGGGAVGAEGGKGDGAGDDDEAAAVVVAPRRGSRKVCGGRVSKRVSRRGK